MLFVDKRRYIKHNIKNITVLETSRGPLRTFCCVCYSEEVVQTPRDDVLIDIDDKEPLITSQVGSVTFQPANRLINQSIKQQVNQPTDQSINEFNFMSISHKVKKNKKNKQEKMTVGIDLSPACTFDLCEC